MLYTDNPQAAVEVICIGFTGQPHALDRSSRSYLELSAQTEGVSGQLIAYGLSNSVVFVINGLVESHTLEAVSDLVGTGKANTITLATAGIFICSLVSQCSLDNITFIVQRHAGGVGINIIASHGSFMQRVAQLGEETAHVRSGVLDGVVITLVEAGVANTGQVAHVTDLVTEQVGRATGCLEGAVKTASADSTEVATQTHEGVASSQSLAVVRTEIDLLLDLEERVQVRADVVVALEAQAGGVARQVDFGIVGAVIEVVDRDVGATVYGHVCHCRNRHGRSGPNNNRKQLLLHQYSPRYFKRQLS